MYFVPSGLKRVMAICDPSGSMGSVIMALVCCSALTLIDSSASLESVLPCCSSSGEQAAAAHMAAASIGLVNVFIIFIGFIRLQREP